MQQQDFSSHPSTLCRTFNCPHMPTGFSAGGGDGGGSGKCPSTAVGVWGAAYPAGQQQGHLGHPYPGCFQGGHGMCTPGQYCPPTLGGLALARTPTTLEKLTVHAAHCPCMMTSLKQRAYPCSELN